jgi:hypothetical protein
MKFSIERKDKIAELLAEEVREQLGSEAGIDQIEGALREIAKEVSGLGLQKVIEESEERYRCAVECGCGQVAHPIGKRSAVLWTVFGKVEYRRRYYVCSGCHVGQSPLDAKHGIKPGQTTGALASLLGIWGVEVSFEEASQLAERFLLFRVSDDEGAVPL